jgi:hypothetical protein
MADGQVPKPPLIERPPRPRTGLGRLRRDFGSQYAANAFIGVVFSATGPVAVILAVGTQGGLSSAELASWIFGVFFLNGVLTVVACWLYRQPLAMFWTIPGTVLLGPALGHLAWPEVLGAFFVTGLLILLLGLTGWVRRMMSVIPMPIVMAMVAAVFLRFGIELVRALGEDFTVVAPMVLVFLGLSAWPLGARYVPPIIGALVVGAVAVAASGQFGSVQDLGQWTAAPLLQAPQWSVQAMIELVIPLAITVLVVQNGQGIAVLRAAGHAAPINAVTVACGVWSLLVASVDLPDWADECVVDIIGRALAPLHCRHLLWATRDAVRALRALVHATHAGHPRRIHRRTCWSGDAPRAAIGLRHGVQHPLHAGCPCHIRGHRRGHLGAEHRCRILGVDRGHSGVTVTRAGGLRRPTVGLSSARPQSRSRTGQVGAGLEIVLVAELGGELTTGADA